jgi:hypothetical protein
MLFIHQKHKPMITKENVSSKKDKQDFKPIQGKGLNELIEKVKDMKVKELTKKRKTNSNSKISFN